MKKTIFRLGAAFVIGLAAGTAQAQACQDPDTLRIAVIPQMTDQTSGGHYDALMASLQEELKRNVVLIPVGSYGAVVEGLFDGSLHLAELGPGSYALARDRGTDITAFASLHREMDASGPPDYRSALVTRKDAGIQSLDQLQGAALSLVDPASTSGGIVPRAALLRMTGTPLEHWFGRVSFAGSHDAALDAVLNRHVAAAFVSDNRVSAAVHQGRPAFDLLHVVWTSDPIPADPFVYQNSLCEPVKLAIHRVFFEKQEALQPLFSWRGMQGFVPVSDVDYQHLMQGSAAAP